MANNDEFSHKEMEAELAVRGHDYNAQASPEEKRRFLQDMVDDTDRCIRSREEENERLGIGAEDEEEDGTEAYENHERRIEVLKANKAAYELERLHADEMAAGRESGACNEEDGDWGAVAEERVGEEEHEEETGSDSSEDSGEYTDFDLEPESSKEDEKEERDEERDMEMGSDSESDSD